MGERSRTEMDALLWRVQDALSYPLGFEDWLLSVPEGYAVGKAGAKCGCPIYRYLKETVETPDLTEFVVACQKVEIETEEEKGEYGAPLWVWEFVDELDGRHTGLVTREQALKVLQDLGYAKGGSL